MSIETADAGSEKIKDKIQTLDDVLENEQIFQLFVSHISHRVDEITQSRQTRFFQRFSIISGVLFALLAGAAAVYFETIVEARSEAAVRDKLQAEISSAVEAVKSEALYFRFLNLANSISASTSFSINERDAVLDLLESIANIESLSERPEFPDLLEKTLDALTSAGVTTQVERIDSLFRGEILKNSGIIQTFVLHFGRRLLESRDPPNDWSQSDLDRLGVYIDAARSRNYPEFALPYELMIDFVKAGMVRTEYGEAAFMEVNSDLTEREKDTFVRLVDAYSAPEKLTSQDPPPASLVRLSKIAQKFISVYSVELARAGMSN